MRWGALVFAVCLAIAAGAARASSVESWSLASSADFLGGTLEGTAVDAEGRVTLAPSGELLWGPDQGIVWDLAPSGSASVFVALSSPTRVLKLEAGKPAVPWHATGDETLVATILSDSDGGVYMGISPVGIVVHATEPGLPIEIANTGALFVWDIEATPDGAIWIGTGVPGKLLRIDAAGEVSTILELGDDSVRSIAPDGESHVLVGTGGRGRVLRVSNDGTSSVLFDAEEPEIVAVARAADGSALVLTASGSKQVAAANAAATPRADVTVNVTATAPPGPNGEPRGADPERNPPQRSDPPRFRMLPGGALYRIEARGDERTLWRAAAGEVPFSMALAADAAILVATGDFGRLHRIEPDGRSSVLLQLPSEQASAISIDATGRLLAGGTTDARVVRFEPAGEGAGRYITGVKDAGAVADWGKLNWDAELPAGAKLRAWARTGNTAEPDQTWSEWQALSDPPTLESSRWAQLRVDLTPGRAGASPLLRRLELFFRPHNRRPVIEALEVQPAGVVWSYSNPPTRRPFGPLVTDDPVTRRVMDELSPNMAAPQVRKSYEQGAQSVNWQVNDPDGDPLRYRVEIRAEGSGSWIPLAVDLEADFHGWDARSLPDGLYRVRLIADDSLGNPEGKGASDSRISGLFRIDNTRPSVGPPTVRERDGKMQIEFVAADPGGNVVSTEVAIDAGNWEPLDPDDGVADSAEESYRLVLEPARSDGRTIRVRVTDASGNMGGDAWAFEGRAP